MAGSLGVHPGLSYTCKKSLNQEIVLPKASAWALVGSARGSPLGGRAHLLPWGAILLSAEEMEDLSIAQAHGCGVSREMSVSRPVPLERCAHIAFPRGPRGSRHDKPPTASQQARTLGKGTFCRMGAAPPPHPPSSGAKGCPLPALGPCSCSPVTSWPPCELARDAEQHAQCLCEHRAAPGPEAGCWLGCWAAAGGKGPGNVTWLLGSDMTWTASGALPASRSTRTAGLSALQGP